MEWFINSAFPLVLREKKYIYFRLRENPTYLLVVFIHFTVEKELISNEKYSLIS